MEDKVWRIGDKCRTTRQNGKEGKPFEDTGEILKFSEMIRINGEPTARVKYDSDGSDYVHGISTLKPV